MLGELELDPDPELELELELEPDPNPKNDITDLFSISTKMRKLSGDLQ